MQHPSGLVLVIEPDAETRAEYELTLARGGFRAAAASDGPSGLRLARRYVPDAVIIEIILPTLDGFYVADRLRRQLSTRDVGIVAVTHYDADDLARRATESGIDVCLAKPGSPDELLRAVCASQRRLNSLRAAHRSAGKPRAVSEWPRHGVERAPAGVDLDQAARMRSEPAPMSDAAGAGHGQMLAEADGAREVMLVDPPRGEALFAALLERYANAPLLYFKRGEAYRALGRRKQAHQDFDYAARTIADPDWRERARFAARRTRSHHEK